MGCKRRSWCEDGPAPRVRCVLCSAAGFAPDETFGKKRYGEFPVSKGHLSGLTGRRWLRVAGSTVASALNTLASRCAGQQRSTC